MNDQHANNQTAMTSIPGVLHSVALRRESGRRNTSQPTNHTEVNAHGATRSCHCTAKHRGLEPKTVESKEAEADTLPHGNRRETTEPQSGSVQQRCN